MANPPVNRRPGVDASIVQADWVRGYDGPQVGDDPCDIILSNGANEVDGRVSDLYIWNRTPDREQPMFIFAVGADFTALDSKFGVYAGPLPDPNGIIFDKIGSLYLSNNPAALWQNQDGVDTWKQISDDLGGENLEETLAIGNFTGDQALVISDGVSAFIIGEENTTGGDGAPVKIYGGTASGVTGDGGDVWLTSGATTGGNTGEVLVQSADVLAGTGNVGAVRLLGGNTTLGGNGGDISATGGNGVQGGEVLLQGGDGANPGGDRGGRIQFLAGNSPADGDGGRINIAGGSPGTPIAFSNSFTAGQGGQINIVGGNSASAEDGGIVFLRGGTGGSAGGVGGGVILEGGPGGGGADDGKIEARGIFFGDNYLRDDGDPNVLGKVAPEGSIYQRSTAGFGQAWVNVDGTGSGWSQLLGAGGGIVSALTQVQYGSLTAGSDVFGTDELAADGILWATNASDIAYEVTNGKTLFGGYDGTPALFLGAAGGLTGGVWVGTLLSRTSHSRLVFKFGVASILADQRIFVGCTKAVGGNDIPTQLGSDNPGGTWFGLWKKTGETNFRFQAQGVGNDSQLSSVTIVEQQVYYVLFDLLDDADGGVTITILDDSYTQLDQHTFSPLNSVIGGGVDLRFIAGTGSSGIGNSLVLNMISVVTRTDIAAAAFAGGLAGFAPPLSQVLLAGNETGASDIVVDHNQGVFGKLDGNAPLGGSLSIGSGRATNVAGTSGGLFLSSGFAAGGVLTGGTGDVLLASGGISGIAASGATGQVLIGSGASGGASGSTGDVSIQSGAFIIAGGGALATTGDINIEVGGAAASDANPGLLSLKGGVTSLNGVIGGGIDILSGSNTINGDSGNITIATADAASLDGGTGNIFMFAGLAGDNSGTGGTVLISAGFGNSPGAPSGDLVMGAGFAFPGSLADGGDVSILSGNSESAQGGNIQFITGGSTIGGFRGGDFIFTPGTGPAGDGEVIINGKLTVTGLIDPTGLVLTGQALVPTVVNPGDGLLWVDNTGLNTILNYTDDANVTIQLGAGGGGGDLAATLVLGNNTGPNPIEIDPSLSAGIIGTDSAVTDGGNVGILTGSSTVGGGGGGGDFTVAAGTSDPTGNGVGGGVGFAASAGSGTGSGGGFLATTGLGGATDGPGGPVQFTLGAGQGTANGGSFSVFTGDGGAGGGNGGEIRLKPGAGAGGGVDGVVELDGDVRIAGDLQVDGVIDPLGIGFVAQGANPIPLPGGGTPLAGSIWTNVAGDLIFTNIGVGDLNISTSIATGVGSLSATLAVGSTTGANGIEFSTTSPGISGSDNAGGSGADIILIAGSSTGGGGKGGSFLLTSGAPDTDNPGGSFNGVLSPGDGTGNGGAYVLSSGDGGATSGDGGIFAINLGDGGGIGDGGGYSLSSGEGGGGGGNAGNFAVALGSAAAGSGTGGNFILSAGTSFGPTLGGSFFLTGGDGGGGAGAGDGGLIVLQGGGQLGVGGFGGIDLLGGGIVLPPAAPGDIRLSASNSATTTGGASLLLNSGDNVKPGSSRWSAGTATAASGAAGGDLDITAGFGDLGGAGGTIRLASGNTSGTGEGGAITAFAGTGGGTNDGGLVHIRSGGPTGTGDSGDVTIEVQPSGGLATSRAGSLFLRGGDLVNGDVAFAGSVILQGGGFGFGAPTVNGGLVTVAGGDLRTPGFAANFPVAGAGGRVVVRGGVSEGTINGGTVEIQGGEGGDTPAGGADGGRVAISGSGATVGTDGDGGDVTIRAGGGDGTGVPGQINLGDATRGDTLNADSPAMKFGVAVAIAGPTPITWAGLTGTAFSATPRMIQLTIEATAPGDFPGGAAAMTAFVVTGTSGPLGFTLDIFPAPAAPVAVHVLAYL